MKTTQTLSATLFALSLAVAGVAQAATGGPVDPKTGDTVATGPVISSIASSSEAPEGTIAALHAARSTGQVIYSSTPADGTIAALHGRHQGEILQRNEVDNAAAVH